MRPVTRRVAVAIAVAVHSQLHHSGDMTINSRNVYFAEGSLVE
jgi:hypothetical protein